MPSQFKPSLGNSSEFFYANGKKLMQRISMWNKFGTNTMTYGQFLDSLITTTYKVYADFGCGNAFHSSNLLKHITDEAYFVDSSSGILKEARDNVSNFVQNSSPNVKTSFIESDVTRTNIPEGKVNLLTLMHVLHHLDDVEDVVKEIHRVIDPSGRIIITTYSHSLDDWINRTHYQALRDLDFPDFTMDKLSYREYSGDNLSRLLRNRFSSIERVDYRNDALVSDRFAVLQYYRSAMMYRMSKGQDDDAVCSEKWEHLSATFEERLEEKLAKDGVILIDGAVSAFVLRP